MILCYYFDNLIFDTVLYFKKKVREVKKDPLTHNPLTRHSLVRYSESNFTVVDWLVKLSPSDESLVRTGTSEKLNLVDLSERRL